MYKNNKLIISKILIIVSLVSFLLAGIYFTQVFLSQKSVNKNKVELSISKELVDTLSSEWQEGGVDRLSTFQKDFCPQLVDHQNKVSSDFYRCNPEFINCFLHGFSIRKYRPIKFGKYYFEFSKFGEPIITFAKNKKDFFRIKLLDTCSDVYLPQKKYSAGPKESQKYIWDNFNQNVYIDKYYVSNLDVYFWKLRQKIPFSNLEKNISKELYKPNTTLTVEEKDLFCYHHGKKVLESRFFDAASYIPNKEDSPKLVKKFPYHWTKKRQIEKFKCYDVYARGCESEREYKFFEGLSTGWTGIHFILGNYMEYLPNKFVKENNLKVSSFYLPANSSWHEIGKRGTLGKTDLKYFQEQEGVAFRCMATR